MQDTSRADAYQAKLAALTPEAREAHYEAMDRALKPSNALEEYATATNGTRMNLHCGLRILERRLEAAGMLGQVLHPDHPEAGTGTIGEVVANMHRDFKRLNDEQERLFAEDRAGKVYPEKVPFPVL